MRRAFPPALLCLALLMNTAHAGGVVVVPLPPDEALVAWSPDPGADSYNVYGVSAGARTYLTSTTYLFAKVAAGYDDYLVVTVVAGVEVNERPTCVFIRPPEVEVRPC